MQIQQVEEGTKRRRDQTREAIALATQGRWDEAVEANRELLASFPDDVEALNRYGKALSEMGRYSEARQAFQQALKRSPTNSIASKNLDRLAHLKDSPGTRPSGRLTPLLFIEDRGKSCMTSLQNPAPKKVLAHAAAGDILNLQMDGATVYIAAREGVILGQLEPKLAARLIRLISGGNRYVAAVAATTDREIFTVLREVYQHPQMSGIVSFPSRSDELVTYLPVAEEELDEEDLSGSLMKEWAGSEEAEEGVSTEKQAPPPKGVLAEDVSEEEEQ